jgi:LPXTG-motif cell wall-anchored protein
MASVLQKDIHRNRRTIRRKVSPGPMLESSQTTDRRGKMKGKIFTLLMVLVLALSFSAVAQNLGSTTQGTNAGDQDDQQGNTSSATGTPDPQSGTTGTGSATMGQSGTGTTGTTTGTMGTGSTGLQNDTTTTGTMNDQTGTTGTYTDTADQTGTYGSDTRSLPDTASNTPLFALLGLLSLAGAFVVRMVR